MRMVLLLNTAPLFEEAVLERLSSLEGFLIGARVMGVHDLVVFFRSPDHEELLEQVRRVPGVSSVVALFLPSEKVV